MFKCMECGRKFRTTKAAERAANNGCPGCGGVDIDLDNEPLPKHNSPQPCVGCESPTSVKCVSCGKPSCGRAVGLCGNAGGICAICVEERLKDLCELV